MFGVVINNIKALREKGYSFIENDYGYCMKIKRDEFLWHTITVNSEGKLEIRDCRGRKIGVYNNAEYLLDRDIDNILCVLEK